MPRYNITYRASDASVREITCHVWAQDDTAARRGAVTRLSVLRNTRRDYRALDEWEVWTGVPPYTRRKTVAAGRMAARS